MASEKPTVVALTIDVDGTTERIALPSADLEAWQKAVNPDGCYLEWITTQKFIITFDEYGQDRQLPLNMAASVLTRKVGRPADIVGKVLVIGRGPDDDGEPVDLDEDEMESIEGMAERVRAN